MGVHEASKLLETAASSVGIAALLVELVSWTTEPFVAVLALPVVTICIVVVAIHAVALHQEHRSERRNVR